MGWISGHHRRTVWIAPFLVASAVKGGVSNDSKEDGKRERTMMGHQLEENCHGFVS
jgi:hypothetical protein